MGAMRFLASSEGHSIKNVVNAFNWKGLGNGLVVDIGGSFGHVCYELAEAAPELNFVVQDLEKVVAQAQKERANDEHANHIEFQAHSFFTPQPVKHADVYFLRFICHDYGDKYAARILANIIPAMGPNSIIMIVDEMMPEVGVLSKIEEHRAR
jgi:6-hydroxytryprostatin B O-methyltransferase